MPDFHFETDCHARGLAPIAGIDEAGRGPLAGPVMAAAVILPHGEVLAGLNDSKKLTASRRDSLYEAITQHPGIRWALGVADPEEIDRLNILRATHLAMRRAAEGLGKPTPNHCLIDGLPVKNFPMPHEGIVKGDAKSLSIAAASIIAKVARDRYMIDAAARFPQYGFERHKGYGTKAHLEALRHHGPCRLHRQSFQPVAQRMLPFDEA